jgi:hypothetical protein
LDKSARSFFDVSASQTVPIQAAATPTHPQRLAWPYPLAADMKASGGI